jgi:hypothetical protein
MYHHQKHQDIGMVGYLGDKVTASPLLRAFLDAFCNLGEIFWCKTAGDGTVHEANMERLSQVC